MLYGRDAMSLSEFAKKYPGYADPLLTNNAFILEKAARKTETFPLPTLTPGNNAVVLAIMCDSASKYDVAVLRGMTTVDHTWGASCGRTGVVLYTTAPIPGSHVHLSVRATVAAGTPYRVAVLETKSTTN